MSKYSNKFHVVRRNSTPVPYPTFVLRLDGNDPHAIVALRAYAKSIEDENSELADELLYIARVAEKNKNFTVQQLLLSLKSR